ncbi:PTS lactose/cellobiose transporter subunit IIA [Carnobacterium gallinarum]|uniref:PTS lactose/cellobiose transporter subunit IIA n=1 Tax=Carnobacterium gallinarum TaxID=2749 RepID=UPI0005512032|nr:PTS lactose/cellobiose transporter subunit IIA [Carnobacterium gallinarum]
MERELNEQAMKIILHVGDARQSIAEASKSISQQQYNLAQEELLLAKKELQIANHSQMKILQKERNGEKLPYSYLFNHAQALLISITSEWNITNQLIKIMTNLNRL